MTRLTDGMTNLAAWLTSMFLSLAGGTVTGPTTFQQGLTANGNVTIQNANVTGTFQAQNSNVLGSFTANGNVVIRGPSTEVRGGDLVLGVPGSIQGKLILSYSAVANQGLMIYGTGNTFYMQLWPAATYATVVVSRIQDYQGNGLDLSNLNTSTIIRANGGVTAATFTVTGTNFAQPVQVQGAGTVRSGSFATPNGNVTGSPGDVYLSTAGGAGATLWAKETGAATNTGWVSK